ncbi:MAG: hypothetical protein ACLQU2_13480 [Candidatus Binataceae bacterium]
MRKGEQGDRFRSLSHDFQEVYASFARNDCSPYILDTWQEFNDRFVTLCNPALPVGFLNEEIFCHTMSLNPIRPIWKPYLADVLTFAESEPVELLLEEDLVGNPRICDRAHMTSPGRILHAWMLLRYLSYRRINAYDPTISRIIEFGGGFGGLASIWHRLRRRDLTYVIFDTPIMATIQWHYLSAVLGPDSVVAVTLPSHPVLPGRINILPVSMLPRRDIVGDLFISTWALSESNKTAQMAVADSGWFGARGLLLAYQGSCAAFPYAEDLRDEVDRRGGEVFQMPYDFAHKYCAFV